MRSKPYVVRELPWTRGTKRRLIERYTFFHEALKVAESLSAENRQIAVELRGTTLAVFLNGRKVPPTGAVVTL